MRKGYIFIFLLFFVGLAAKAQIVKWTFETSQPTTSGLHAAEVGTGQASGLHADAATVYSSPAGNGSSHAFSSTRWAAADYYQFQFATTGYQDISITWDATGSNTGPRDFKVQYSTDGTTFFDATGTNSTYSLPVIAAWSSVSYNSASTRTLDLSYATVLNNAATVYIRLVVVAGSLAINGGAIATAGTSRVDDVTINGNAISSNTITLTTLSSLIFNIDCFTDGTGTVDFTSTGTFTAGNVYNVQLSDNTGSFAAPTVIGSFASTANSGTIPISIPAGTPTAALYLIRIRSTNPVVNSNSSAAITINLSGVCVSASSDYFRSKTTGNWNVATTWQSSATGAAGTWINATLTPTSTAQTIEIRNGHTVTVTASVTVDQVVIESGGILNHSGGTITVNDGTGDDIDIQNGGIFSLSLASTPPSYGAGSPTINVATGGILRVTAGGMTGNGTGVNVSNIIYNHQSILEWAPPGVGSFSSGGVTYFPNAGPATIPIFRSSNTVPMQVGAAGNTFIYGIFEAANATVTWENSGTKTFRNGIRGSGNTIAATVTNPSGIFIIDGVTAELGGTGSLTVPTSGLKIGSAGGTAVTVTSDKIVTGDISLLSTNTFVDVGTHNLTVSGNVTGGTTTSYIKTPSTGSLILQTVDAAGKMFPVGHSSYNPVTIAVGSNHDWTVNVNDGVVADPPNGITGAVFRTWGITPSVNPPTTGATLTFQFDISTDVGTDFNIPPYDVEPVQVWHRKLGYWLAVGTTVPLVTVSGNIRTATVTGATQFSPYAISRMSLPLPIKLISFNVVKLSSSVANVTWELAACCSKDARFELEKSTDGINFSSTAAIAGSETNRFYSYLDTRLGKGTTYYRLKATDVDGKKTYSRVIVIINDKQGLMITTMAPNPVSNAATVSIASAKAGMVQFAVTDLSGRIIKQWQAAVAEGNSIFSINTATLTNGIYHLSATMADIKTVIRFVKQ